MARNVARRRSVIARRKSAKDWRTTASCIRNGVGKRRKKRGSRGGSPLAFQF